MKLNAEAVKESMLKVIHDTQIKDIVFTGGEPTSNPKLLRELVEMAAITGKRIFVNTTLPQEHFFECLDVFNSGNIDCLNVSRHCTSCKLPTT